MGLKTPSPYHAEFKTLRFGGWKVDQNEFNLATPGAAGVAPNIMGLASDPMLAMMGLSSNSFLALLGRGNSEVKVLYSGGGKLMYEFPYQTGVPGKNKARIEIPVPSICGIKAEGDTLTLQIRAPPKTFLGFQGFEKGLGSKKTNSKFNIAQHDFSNGEIKFSKVHSVKMSSAKMCQTLAARLGAHGHVAALLAGGVVPTVYGPSIQGLVGRFSHDEVLESMAGTKGIKRAAVPLAPLPIISQQYAAPNVPVGMVAAAIRPAAAAAAAAAAASAAAAAASACSGAFAVPPAKRAAPAVKQNPHMKVEQGWVGVLPLYAGEYMRKSVQRWGLLPPYQLGISDSIWQRYYQERSVLEWYTNAWLGGWKECAQDPRGANAAAALAAALQEQQARQAAALAAAALAAAAPEGAATANSSATSFYTTNAGTGLPPTTSASAESGAWTVAAPMGAGAAAAGAAGGGAGAGQEEEEDEELAQLRFEAERAERLKWTEMYPPGAQGALCHSFCKEFYSGYGDDSDKDGDGSGDRMPGECRQLKRLLANIRSNLKAVASGCKLAPGAAALAEGLAKGTFILSYWVNWEDEDEPRTLNMHTRLYSPCGTPQSVELRFDYHRRVRSCFAEAFDSMKVAARPADSVNAISPLSIFMRGQFTTVLFSADLQDAGYWNRNFLGSRGLKDLTKHLFGCGDFMSERKMFNLLAHAGGAAAIDATYPHYAFKVNRRNHKCYPGEEGSDADSADDSDSSNEELKGRGTSRASQQYCIVPTGMLDTSDDDEDDDDIGPGCRTM